MNVRDIPRGKSDGAKGLFFLRDLLGRARSMKSQWDDIPAVAGIYVVQWSQAQAPQFGRKQGEARHASPTDPFELKKKWAKINKSRKTDILYIGKASNGRRSNLRIRVRALARFGVGKTRNHKGGEWLWQIRNIDRATVLVFPCPDGQEQPFENRCLERFAEEHTALPIANRQGPRGLDRWWPAHS